MQKRNEISATGVVDKNGRLAIYMGEINAFFAENKGQRVIASFHIIPTATSKAMLAYYLKVVVPAIARALYELGERKTQEQTEHFLRELSPVCREEYPNIDSGHYDFRIRELTELSNSEFLEHIDFVRQMGAEELGICIDDPMNV